MGETNMRIVIDGTFTEKILKNGLKRLNKKGVIKFGNIDDIDFSGMAYDQADNDMVCIALLGLTDTELKKRLYIQYLPIGTRLESTRNIK